MESENSEVLQIPTQFILLTFARMTLEKARTVSSTRSYMLNSRVDSSSLALVNSKVEILKIISRSSMDQKSALKRQKISKKVNQKGQNSHYNYRFSQEEPSNHVVQCFLIKMRKFLDWPRLVSKWKQLPYFVALLKSSAIWVLIFLFDTYQEKKTNFIPW